MNVNEMLDKIIGIECPPEHIIDRVVEVLEDFEADGNYQIVAGEDDDLIDDSVKIYKAYAENDAAPSFQFKVVDGPEHYVAKIADAELID